jgi:hypothetical protein
VRGWYTISGGTDPATPGLPEAATSAFGLPAIDRNGKFFHFIFVFFMTAGQSGTETRSHREPATDVCRRRLARIPTLYGRLVYLSSLRNQATGVYEQGALAQMFGQEQASETLRRSHGQIFQEWLCLSLEQQKTDLEEYLGELPGTPAAILAEWKETAPYRNLAPAAVQEVEKRLYLTDLETLLELLRHEYGASSPDPKS